MAHQNNLPQQLLGVPVFDVPHMAYPFDEQNQNSPQELLLVLRQYNFGQLNAAYPVQPLDFTKYTMNDLRIHYGVPNGPFRPLYFFHHWVAHPEKHNKDMTQKTTYEFVDRSVWKRSGRQYSYHNGHELVGFKDKFKLYESIENRPDSSSSYNLDVYTLPDDIYVAEEPSDVKKSVWALVKLYYGN